MCRTCGYPRKYAIPKLNGPPPSVCPQRRRASARGVTYCAGMISILRQVWEAADYPWSVRLKALLPLWLPWIRKRFALTPARERQMLSISPRQRDRRLQGHKRTLRRRLYGRTKPGNLLKHQIPIQAHFWDVQPPGYVEIDLVSHPGNSADGEFICTLNLADIHAGWVESYAVLGKGQRGVTAALDRLSQRLPFLLLAVDSDNGGEFINRSLTDYARAHHLAFTGGATLSKRRQCPCRAEELDPFAQTPGVAALRQSGGRASDERPVCERTADQDERVPTLGQAGAQGAGGFASEAVVHRGPNSAGSLAPFPSGVRPERAAAAGRSV